jgi:hypothetical protein
MPVEGGRFTGSGTVGTTNNFAGGAIAPSAGGVGTLTIAGDRACRGEADFSSILEMSALVHILAILAPFWISAIRFRGRKAANLLGIHLSREVCPAGNSAKKQLQVR